MCKHGDEVICRVWICAEDSHTGKGHWANKAVDACLADKVNALNSSGRLTRSCCCGHGKGKEEIIMHTLIEKRNSRRKRTAEIFTPDFLAEEITLKLEEYAPELFTNPDKTFIDPAVGNGQLLIPVLKRKLKYTNPVQAISTIYACDIMRDNIIECRNRLLEIIKPYKPTKKQYKEIIKILARNIVHTPLSKYPKGSLDYLDLPSSETFENYDEEYIKEKLCLP